MGSSCSEPSHNLSQKVQIPPVLLLVICSVWV